MYNPKLKFILGIIILLISIITRFLQPEGGITLDEADYSIAARQGVIANYLDKNDTRTLRHWHGPLTTYTIIASTKILGQSESAVRLPNRIIGSLTPLILFIMAIYAFQNGVLIGAISGFILALMPISVQVSNVANMHTLATLFIVFSFYFLLLFIKKQKSWFLGILGITIGLLFTTLEYAFIITGIAFLVLLLYPTPYFEISITKIRVKSHTILAVFLILITILMIWGAGIFKLHIFKNLLFYIRYSKHGHPILFDGKLLHHLPQWAYLVWYWKLAPVFLILSIGSLFFLLYSLIKTRKAEFGVLSIFVLVLLITLLKQHIMSARYSVHIVPFLCLTIAILLTQIITTLKKVGYMITICLITLVTITNIPHIYSKTPGDPGYKEVANYLRNHATENVNLLSWYPGIIKFYLPEFKNIESYNSGGATSELMSLLESRYFDYIITYHNQVRRWPDDQGILYIKKYYLLEKTYYWQEEPVLWLYKKPD